MHVVAQSEAGPVVNINCPKCKARGVPSESYDKFEMMGGITHRTSWVKCGRCGKKLLSKVPVIELSGHTPEELEEVVVDRQAGTTYFNIAAITFCWVPILGQVLTIVGLMTNKKRTAWWWICLAGLVIGLGLIAFLARDVIFPPPKDIRGGRAVG